MAYNSEAAQAATATDSVNTGQSVEGGDVSLALATSVGSQIQAMQGALQQTALGAGPAIDQLADAATQMLSGQWAIDRFTGRIAANLERGGNVQMPQMTDAFQVTLEPVDLSGNRDRFLGLFGNSQQKSLPNPFEATSEDAVNDCV